MERIKGIIRKVDEFFHKPLVVYLLTLATMVCVLLFLQMSWRIISILSVIMVLCFVAIEHITKSAEKEFERLSGTAS